LLHFWILFNYNRTTSAAMLTALPETVSWISGDCFIAKGKKNGIEKEKKAKKWKERKKRRGENTP